MLGESSGSSEEKPSGTKKVSVQAAKSAQQYAAKMSRNSANNWSSSFALDLATMCNWYEFNQSLFHHQWAAAFEYKAAMAAAIYPSSAKRRKTDSLGGATSSHSQAEITRLKKRGHVTFKPYNTEETSGVNESLYLSHFRCHPYATIYGALGSVSESECRRRPLKRKLGAISPEETERLGVLQARMDTFWSRREDRARHPCKKRRLISKV